MAETMPQFQQKNAAVYCRVSTKDQADRGFSLPAQQEHCLALAQEHGYTVSHVFAEDYSGVTLRRPQFSQLRELVRTKQVQAIVIYDMDRLSRKLAHQLLLEDEFEAAGVDLHITTQPDRKNTPEGRMLDNMREVFSEYERERILARTREGRENRAKAGHVPYGGRTYGYVYVRDTKGAHYEIHPEESLIVQRIFEMYTQDGMSQEAIAERLTREGIPTPKTTRKLATGTWRQSTIKFILRNETYIGIQYDGKRKNVYAETDEGRKVRYEHCPREEWIAVPVPVPAVIDRQVWDKAQALRVTNKKEARRNRKHTYLLAGGRLRCGVCGYAMSPHMSQERQARYRCVSSNRHYAMYHEVKSVRADQVEPEAWGRVERMLSHPPLVFREFARRQEQAGKQQERIDRDRQSYERQLERIESERGRLLEAYLGAALDLARFKATDAELVAKRQRIKQELAALDADQRAIETGAVDLQAVYDYCVQWADQLDAITPERKAQCIRVFGIVATWTPGQPLEITGAIYVPIDSSTL